MRYRLGEMVCAAAMAALLAIRGRNKSSAKSYAKVERSRNVMRHGVALPGGEAT